MSGAAPRGAPTVVVARQVVPGREPEFERWIRRLSLAASAAPGHVRSDVEPPGPAHPDEWTIVYRFADIGHLRAWLESPERAALIAEGADLIVGPAREQVLALPTDTVTAVSSVRVRPEHQETYRELHEEMLTVISTFPGFRRSEVVEPVPGIQDDTVVLFAFDERPQLDAWLASDERRRIVERMAPLVEGDRVVNVLGGFAGWFGTDGASAEVRRWKQAATVLLALAPTTVVVNLARVAVLPDLPLVPAVLLGNLVTVPILTWGIMPQLTRVLDGWLRR